jgi:beta-glucosidase
VHQGYASNYIGCGNLPLYPFGHGLSYTTFAYKAMELDSHEMTKDGKITVRVTVKNEGDRAGKEVVQLYIHDLYASAVRPIQQLVAFEKIALDAGEEKVVTFEITEEMLRFYDLSCKHISEPGDFDVFVGHADHAAVKDTFRLV